MRNITKFILTFTSAAVLTTGFAMADTASPTAESALATEESIAHALQANDTTALDRLLASDWIVVSARGGWVGRDDIIQAIKTGLWTHTMVVISEPRVRIYGTTAVVTEHAAVSGMSGHKPYVNVQECQTDVLVWKDGGWVSELLHETFSTVPSSNC